MIMNEGTVTIGIDYYTRLVEEVAVLKDRCKRLEGLLKTERTMVYVNDVAKIFQIDLSKEVTE